MTCKTEVISIEVLGAENNRPKIVDFRRKEINSFKWFGNLTVL